MYMYVTCSSFDNKVWLQDIHNTKWSPYPALLIAADNMEISEVSSYFKHMQKLSRQYLNLSSLPGIPKSCLPPGVPAYYGHVPVKEHTHVTCTENFFLY